MKKISTLVCSVLLTGAAFAQIPNAGFESWTAHTGYNTPDSWGNLNSVTSLASVYTCEKGTSGAPAGASFIKLTSKTVPVIGVAPGLAVTGTINTTTFSVSGGFPNATRPATFNGQWQYMAFGSDQGHIGIFLSKWNMSTNKRDTVAFTDQALSGMAMSWAPFSINLNYYSGKYPDTAMIILSASGSTPVANSYLWVDSLAFAGSVASGVVTVTNNTLPTTIYPNPASDITNITYYSNQGGNVKISIVDITGKTIKEISSKATRGENSFPINVTGMARGAYFVNISEGQNRVERKLIVE